MSHEKLYTQDELNKAMDIFDVLSGFDYDLNFEKKGGIYFNNELIKTVEEFIEKVFTVIPNSIRYEIIRSVLSNKLKDNISSLFKEKAASELKLWRPFSHNFNLKLLNNFKKFENVFINSLCEAYPKLYNKIFKDDINKIWEELNISLKENDTPNNIKFIIKNRFYYNVSKISPVSIDKIKDLLKEKTIWDFIVKQGLIELKNEKDISDNYFFNKYIIEELGKHFVESNDEFFLRFIDDLRENKDLNNDELYGMSLLFLRLAKSVAFYEHKKNNDTDYSFLVKINNRYQDFYSLKSLWHEIIVFEKSDNGIIINFNELEILRHLNVRQEGVDLVYNLNQKNKGVIHDLLVFGMSNGKDKNLNGINGFLDILKDVFLDNGIDCSKDKNGVIFTLHLTEINSFTKEKENEIKNLIISLFRKINFSFFNNVDTFEVEMRSISNKVEFKDIYEIITNDLLPTMLKLQMKSDIGEKNIITAKAKIKKF